MATEGAMELAEAKAAGSSGGAEPSASAQKPAVHSFFKKTSEKKLEMKMEAEAKQRARATTPTSIPDEEQSGPSKPKSKRSQKQRSDSGPSKGSKNPKSLPVPPPEPLTSSPGFLLQSTRTDIDPVTAAAPPAPPTPSSSPPPPLPSEERHEADAEVDLNPDRRKRRKKTPPCASVRVELDPDTGMILNTPERAYRQPTHLASQSSNRLIVQFNKSDEQNVTKALLTIKATASLDPVVLLPRLEVALSSPALPSRLPEYDALSEVSAARKPARKWRSSYVHNGGSLLFSVLSSNPPREPTLKNAFAILGKKKPEPVAKAPPISEDELYVEKDEAGRKKGKRKRTKNAQKDTAPEKSSVETLEAAPTSNEPAPATTVSDATAPSADAPPSAPPASAKPEAPKVPKVVHPFFSAAGRKKMAQKAVVTESADQNEIESDKTIASSDASTKPAARSTGSSSWGFMNKPALFSGSNSNHVLKAPGMLEAPWPAKGTAHVRGLSSPAPCCRNPDGPIITKHRKLKDRTLVTVEENLLSNLSHQLNLSGLHNDLRSEGYGRQKYLHVSREVRIPERIVMSAIQLQDKIRPRISARLPHPKAVIHVQETDTDSDSRAEMMQRGKVHPSLLRSYARIGSELAPFDKNECETIPWEVKYAPATSSEVLQPTRETEVLRSWLMGLRIDRVDIPSGKAKKGSAGRVGAVKKKRKKKDDGLDGFVITSEEEEDMMSEITDPEDEEDWTTPSTSSRPKKSIIRAGDKRQDTDFFRRLAEPSKKTNTVLISGPNGCGKTAAVYAVAKELGYAVFEVSPGMKRNGKDVVDQVGDMSRNHLVHQSKHISTEQDNPFAKAKAAARSSPTPSVDEDTQKRQQQQQQSLILLEEVDILFEEDKTFWTSVIGLMAKSKRPIIMTCNDESLLPLDTLSLHAILRFSEPSPDLMVDQLLLICANEGHLLKRTAVDALVKANNNDLRSSIMDLQLYCQVGVADRTGGLNWQLIRWPPPMYETPQDRLRVVSVNTYEEGMGWVDNSPDAREEHQWQQVWEEYGIDIGAANIGIEDYIESMEGLNVVDKKLSLKTMDEFFGAQSAADAFSGLALACIDQPQLDVSYPDCSDINKLDDQLGYSILQTDPFALPGSIATELSIYSRSLSRRLLTSLSPITTSDHITAITNRHIPLQSRTTYQSLFLPLTKHEPLFASTPQTSISSILTSLRPLATDVAPWVRSIVRNDIAMERERRRRNGLLSLGGKRKTRAARLAVEGGSREKKERWLRGVGAEVLGTAGEGWEAFGGCEEGVVAGEEDTGGDDATEVDEIMSED